MNVLTKVVLALVIVGAINWGLIGFFNWNLVNAIFGGDTATASNWFSRVIYSLVGLSGLYLAAVFPKLKEVTHGKARAPHRAEARV